MSDRVCYLARREQGALFSSARLLGPLTDDRWEPPPGENGNADPVGLARAAGQWVCERLASRDGQRARLRTVCLDVDGAACGWLTAPSAEESVVSAAAAAQTDADAGGAPGVWSSPGEASVQALADGPDRSTRPTAHGPGAGRRLAVLNVPDASARVFLDALDEGGVCASSVVSLWHAAASAWDPSGPAAASVAGALRGDRVVATSAPVTGVVLVDPAGRLVWSWSISGELVCGGSVRLAMRDGAASVSRADVGRITAEWLAWSAQLGVAPSRIVVVTPRLVEEEDTLSAGALGQGLGRAWPGATVDLATNDDPVGATLLRLAEFGGAGPGADPRAALVRLTHRPARAHRSLYRAAAAAILCGAIGLSAIGVRGCQSAGVIGKRLAAMREQTLARITAAVPAAAGSPFAEKDLDDELGKLRAVSDAGRELQPAKPILAELEAISFALTKDTKPERLTLTDSSVMLGVVIPVVNLGAGQELLDSLRAVGGSHCEWKEGETQARGADKILFYINGAWRTGGGR